MVFFLINLVDGKKMKKPPTHFFSVQNVNICIFPGIPLGAVLKMQCVVSCVCAVVALFSQYTYLSTPHLHRINKIFKFVSLRFVLGIEMSLSSSVAGLEVHCNMFPENPP